MSLVEKVRSAKEKLGINIGIGAYNKSRRKKDKEKGSRDVKNKRGRTTGKEYWNPSTGKWQSTPIKRGRNLPGGSHHKGGEIGRKSDKPSEGKFKTKPSSKTSGVGPVKSGDEYAKKLKGTTKGVGPVKDGDTYAKGIKNSKTQSTTKNRPDDLASLKKKLKRHASGKNSVAKTKLKLKIRKLEGK